MTRRANTFDDLVAALRGQVADPIDWTRVIGMANHALVSAELYPALRRSGQIDRLPTDVNDYLQMIDERNRERNARLRAQLFEALDVFNSNDISPVLLKGAVPLLLSGERELPTRMTSDLDVAVEDTEMDAALACLTSLGYLPADDFRGMGRSQDVGIFELRPVRATGRPDQTVDTVRNGVRARIPSPTSRAEHWMLHDVVKEGDFVRGRVDLRHMLDLAVLAGEFEVKWSELRAAHSSRLDLLAIDTQLFALNALFEVQVPDIALNHRSVRFHHWRRIFSARHRVAGIPMRLAGNLAWAGLRARRLGPLLRRRPLEALRRGVGLLIDLNPRAKL